MPLRWYFIIGDLIANCATGFIVALFCSWLIDPGWSMLIAMIVAMAIGMFLSMLLAILLFMRFFGAMEVMIPTMLSGMWAGMIVGMRAAMEVLNTVDAALLGLLTGLAVIALCWSVNGRLQGKNLNFTTNVGPKNHE